MNVEFRAWEKITRENPFNVTISEKINGTNGCIIVDELKGVVGVQSRKRLITPDNDNFGFARWVEENKEELSKLGHGYHYGEWAGPGIQKNDLNLPEKQFFLFNTFRWNENNPNKPQCCNVVPVLYQGILHPDTVPMLLEDLKNDTSVKHEGVVVFYHAFKKYTKHTIESPDGKWCKG